MTIRTTLTIERPQPVIVHHPATLSSVTPYPGWRVRLDADGSLRHEKIPFAPRRWLAILIARPPKWPLRSRLANLWLGIGVGILVGHFLIGH